MTEPAKLAFLAPDLDDIATAEGAVAVMVAPDGKLDQAARRANRLSRGALARLVESRAFAKAAAGDALSIDMPAGMAAERLVAVKLDRRADAATARRAGANAAQAAGNARALHAFTGTLGEAAAFAEGALLRRYSFDAHKTGEAEPLAPVSVYTSRAGAEDAALISATVAGVFFTRDLVREPANVLTTEEFARRLEGLRADGIEVEVLDEPELERLGMRALLGVGQGSASPSKVVVMRWNGGQAEAAPLALVGKGVVFDTGGISLKPAAGMEEMTMDMGGAAVVAGTMRTLARRGAKANVVGAVGLVENMPGSRAQRPGDVVRSMKGDTIEVINTDAEGRLVLADVLWFVQERHKPAAIVDLATLTGAIIIALGHENAGLFANDDGLAEALLAAAARADEGLWRMPLGAAYDKQLKSDIADMKNVGGRPAGSITAAQFLKRFVAEGTPWAHIDIAGVTLKKNGDAYAPKGASGWGVRTLDALVAARYEG